MGFKLEYGYTRLVICMGRYVGKIPIPGPIYFAARVIFWSRREGVLNRFKNTSDHRRLITILKFFIFGGFYSNYEEWRFYKATKDSRLAKVVFAIPGILVIQERMAPIPGHMLSHCPFRKIAENYPDLMKPENFGLNETTGMIVLLDFGNPTVNEEISRFSKGLNTSH